MGHTVKPKVFLLGETQANRQGIRALLEHLGAPDWYSSDATSDSELLTEIMGRSCYKSFGTKLNPNITRVRKTNKSYLTNTLEKGDGSIFEHCVTNWFFADVSRVFTHELVRHRVGVAISQESLRFVRLTDLNWYAPTVVEESEDAMKIYSETMETLSQIQRDLADLFEMEEGDKDFDLKKKLTSTFRRLAPLGLATNIGWSANFRTLRHVIEQRTAPWAEEEIRLVFSEVGTIAMERWPHIFADYETELVDGLLWFKTANRKV